MHLENNYLAMRGLPPVPSPATWPPPWLAGDRRDEPEAEDDNGTVWFDDADLGTDPDEHDLGGEG